MKLDLRLIIPGSAVGTILLTDGNLLPSAAIEGDQDEATVVAATAYLRDVMGLRTPVLVRALLPPGQTRRLGIVSSQPRSKNGAPSSVTRRPTFMWKSVAVLRTVPEASTRISEPFSRRR